MTPDQSNATCLSQGLSLQKFHENSYVTFELFYWQTSRLAEPKTTFLPEVTDMVLLVQYINCSEMLMYAVGGYSFVVHKNVSAYFWRLYLENLIWAKKNANSN